MRVKGGTARPWSFGARPYRSVQSSGCGPADSSSVMVALRHASRRSLKKTILVPIDKTPRRGPSVLKESECF
jgi:hypothetical protein